jgi:hypothetical protein
LHRVDLLMREAMRRLDVRADDGFADWLADLHDLAEATAPPRPAPPAVTWIDVAEAMHRTGMSARWVTEQARTGHLHARKAGRGWMLDEADVDAEAEARAAMRQPSAAA